jgi:hypothetical protein
MAEGRSDMVRWVPEPDEDVSLLTAEFCDAFEGCEKCPGRTTIKELRRFSEVDDLLDPNEMVFCVHWCHKAAPEI